MRAAMIEGQINELRPYLRECPDKPVANLAAQLIGRLNDGGLSQPRAIAFCRSEPSDRFIALTIFFRGVLSSKFNLHRLAAFDVMHFLIPLHSQTFSSLCNEDLGPHEVRADRHAGL